MTVQESIYALLTADTTLASIVSARIFPDVPTDNTPLPFAVYWATDSDRNPTLGGRSTLTKYTVQIECWAVTLAEVVAIQAAVNSVLDCYIGGNITAAFAEGSDTDPTDTGYHGQQTFTVWYTAANITPTLSSLAKITTANDAITMTACDHVLTLDCDGLKLDGTEVGGGRGSQGPQGLRGYQGYQGAVGPQGYQGAVGSQGMSGPQGYQGAVGSQGPQGLRGFPGLPWK